MDDIKEEDSSGDALSEAGETGGESVAGRQIRVDDVVKQKIINTLSAPSPLKLSEYKELVITALNKKFRGSPSSPPTSDLVIDGSSVVVVADSGIIIRIPTPSGKRASGYVSLLMALLKDCLIADFNLDPRKPPSISITVEELQVNKLLER